MKIKRILSIVLTSAIVVFAAACGNGTAQNSSTAPAQSSTAAQTSAVASGSAGGGEVTVTDMVGREVKVTPGSYKKVVCIGAGALRMYSYIGDVSLLSGVEDIDNTTVSERPKMFDGVARPYVMANEETFNKLPSCGVGGPNAQAAEAEKILSCKPDIVISEYEDVDKENALADQLGVPVITLKAGPQGVFDDAFAGSMKLLGQIFNAGDKADTLLAFINKEKAEISKRTADIKEENKPSVYICGLGNWGTTNHLMTSQNYVSFNVANVKNVVTGLQANGIQTIEKEKFVELGPKTDIMFVDAAAVKNIKPLYAEDPKMFDDMKAWKEGNVYLEMAYNAYYTNFEIALINTWYIAKTVYPDQFKDIDITAKTNEVTKAFLGKEMASDIFAKQASFGGYKKIDTAAFFK